MCITMAEFSFNFIISGRTLFNCGPSVMLGVAKLPASLLLATLSSGKQKHFSDGKEKTAENKYLLNTNDF